MQIIPNRSVILKTLEIPRFIEKMYVGVWIFWIFVVESMMCAFFKLNPWCGERLFAPKVALWTVYLWLSNPLPLCLFCFPLLVHFRLLGLLRLLVWQSAWLTSTPFRFQVPSLVAVNIVNIDTLTQVKLTSFVHCYYSNCWPLAIVACLFMVTKLHGCSLQCFYFPVHDLQVKRIIQYHNLFHIK